jgi:hypothetical protein
MAQSASFLYACVGATNSQFDNARIAANVVFGPSGTSFGSSDTCFGPSGTSLGGLPGGRNEEALSQQGGVRMVQVVGGGTAAFGDPGESPFAENRTTPERSGGLARALRDLEDFSYDDWDAEGARAITPEVIREAARLLSLLPDGISEPEVAPASDGSVCMEWDSSAGSLWLDIGPDRTAQTLIKIGSLKEERRFSADAPDLATYLRVASERLYPIKQNSAIRSVMVAA